MNFYEERYNSILLRLNQITLAVVETLNQIELQRFALDSTYEDLSRQRIEHLGQIIQQSLRSEKQKRIQQLYCELEQMKKNVKLTDARLLTDLHNEQIRQMQIYYESLLDRCGETRRNSQRVAVGHISRRIHRHSEDYILKTVHEQDLRNLELRLTGGTEISSLSDTINDLQREIQFLKEQLASNSEHNRQSWQLAKTPVQQETIDLGDGKNQQAANGLLAIEFYGNKIVSKHESDVQAQDHGHDQNLIGESHEKHFDNLTYTFREELQLMRSRLRNRNAETNRQTQNVPADDSIPPALNIQHSNAISISSARQFTGRPIQARCPLPMNIHTSAETKVFSSNWQVEQSNCWWYSPQQPIRAASRHQFKYMDNKI